MTHSEALLAATWASRGKRAAWYVAAWSPFVLVYSLVLFTTAAGKMSLVLALVAASATAALPMVAGVAIWRLTRRAPQPDARPFAFAALHGLLATLFTMCWTGWEWLQIDIGIRTGTLDPTIARLATLWNVFIGVVLYVVIAGLSYAVRHWMRARDLALVAERAERLRAQAELAALRAHLNPHFLFNTLHAVGALLRSDPLLAEQALDQLSYLFRYVLRLDRQHVDVVTLEDEWNFTERYLWLEQLRMGSRLRVVADLDDEVGTCAIPAFTLQPLAENAVRHGLAPSRMGGTLRIRAEEHDGFVRLEVADDGVGCTSPTNTVDQGLGIRAVRQRLTALFGAKATTRIDTSAGCGFRLVLSFPAESVPVGPRSLACQS